MEPVFSPGYRVGPEVLGQVDGVQVGIGDPPSAKEAVEAAQVSRSAVSSKRTTVFIKGLLLRVETRVPSR